MKTQNIVLIGVSVAVVGVGTYLLLKKPKRPIIDGIPPNRNKPSSSTPNNIQNVPDEPQGQSPATELDLINQTSGGSGGIGAVIEGALMSIPEETRWAMPIANQLNEAIVNFRNISIFNPLSYINIFGYTDEDTLQEIILSNQYDCIELNAIQETYYVMYGETLVEAIEDDTSGDLRDQLIGRLLQCYQEKQN